MCRALRKTSQGTATRTSTTCGRPSPGHTSPNVSLLSRKSERGPLMPGALDPWASCCVSLLEQGPQEVQVGGGGRGGGLQLITPAAQLQALNDCVKIDGLLALLPPRGRWRGANSGGSREHVSSTQQSCACRGRDRFQQGAERWHPVWKRWGGGPTTCPPSPRQRLGERGRRELPEAPHRVSEAEVSPVMGQDHCFPHTIIPLAPPMPSTEGLGRDC